MSIEIGQIIYIFFAVVGLWTVFFFIGYPLLSPKNLARCPWVFFTLR